MPDRPYSCEPKWSYFSKCLWGRLVITAASIVLASASLSHAADYPQRIKPRLLGSSTYVCYGERDERCANGHNWVKGQDLHIYCYAGSPDQVGAGLCGAGHYGIVPVDMGVSGGRCGYDWYYVNCR